MGEVRTSIHARSSLRIANCLIHSQPTHSGSMLLQCSLQLFQLHRQPHHRGCMDMALKSSIGSENGHCMVDPNNLIRFCKVKPACSVTSFDKFKSVQFKFERAK